MTEWEIKDLIYALEKLTYKTSDGFKLNVIGKDNMPLVEVTIRQFLLNNHDREIGELRAKVYAYEKIIANSNFKAILPAEPYKGGINYD